jgi:hypothetical protein
MVFTIEALDHRQRLIVVEHLDEAEPSAPPGLTVTQDLRGADCPKLLE